MIAWLKKMFAAPQVEARAAAPVEFEGFTIIATPRAVSGGWSTEGLIRKTIVDEVREVTFIRADICMSEQDAVAAAEGKARKIINERGDKMFDEARV